MPDLSQIGNSTSTIKKKINQDVEQCEFNNLDMTDPTALKILMKVHQQDLQSRPDC
jgi:hypothetical protein